jgi:hypothetical protein
LKPVRNLQKLSKRSYWSSSQASQWQLIWDAAPYFERVSHLWEEAESWIAVVGWQLDSRLKIPKPRGAKTMTDDPWETIRDKVIRLCELKPQLEFYLLLWDHALFYMAEREWLQTRVWEELHPRVHLVFDNHHPFGASHHE